MADDKLGAYYMGPRSPAWYGPGYCGICGVRETPPLTPRQVRYWDCDDGWRVGVLCCHCHADCEDNPPSPRDYAYAGNYESASMIEAAADILGDDTDGIYTTVKDSGI